MTSAALWWLAAAAAVVAVVGAGAAAVQLAPRDPVCTPFSEPARSLDLGVSTERAHLQEDVARMRAVAASFADAVSKRPMLSDSIDAEEGARTAPTRARAWCEATLTSQLAQIHALKIDEVRALLAPHEERPPSAGTQADALRASDAVSTSSVVSRPAR